MRLKEGMHKILCSISVFICAHHIERNMRGSFAKPRWRVPLPHPRRPVFTGLISQPTFIPLRRCMAPLNKVWLVSRMISRAHI